FSSSSSSKRKRGATQQRGFCQPRLPGIGSVKRSLGGLQLRADGKGYKSSHPKVARPFSPRLSQHVVLKSSLARGQYSFLLHSRKIERILKKQAEQLGIKLHNVANAGNHLHLFFCPYTQGAFRAFMRTVPGLIVREIT